MTHLYAYNNASASAKALSDSLGIRRIKHEGSRFRGRSDKVVINWGSSSLPDEAEKCFIVNDPYRVGLVANKLSFFLNYGGRDSGCVPSTVDQDVVADWIDERHTVVARHKLSGHSGEGIELITSHPIPNAPLYTLYVPKKDEYRVHVVRTEDGPKVFDIQRKARDLDNPNPNWKVRNHENGFVYARNDLVVPTCVEETSLKVFEATGLDFGAVDIIYNERDNRAYVLEVNTAPGLTGTTLDKYVEMFKENFV